MKKSRSLDAIRADIRRAEQEMGEIEDEIGRLIADKREVSTELHELDEELKEAATFAERHPEAAQRIIELEAARSDKRQIALPLS